MKTCTKCKKHLDLSNFCKDKQKKDGLHPHCKSCRSKRGKRYREENREACLTRSRLYRKNNLEEIRRKDRERNKDSKRAAYKNARNRYNLVKYRSLGKLFQEDTILIYEDCRLLSLVTGDSFEVDHIVPLQGENVSGLHVPWNLQIISRFENRSKSNNINHNPQRTNEPRD